MEIWRNVGRYTVWTFALIMVVAMAAGVAEFFVRLFLSAVGVI